jgi:hypothetical protein
MKETKESKAKAKSKSYNKAKTSPICTGDPYFTGLDQTPNVTYLLSRQTKRRERRKKNHQGSSGVNSFPR